MRFRPNTMDAFVYDEVYGQNAYQVGDFTKDDVVIDIGCHIGSFSKLCADRGAGLVLAYDINAENVAIAKENLKDCSAVQVLHAAVWAESGLVLSHRGFHPMSDSPTINTGSSHLFEPGNEKVMTTSLDSILRAFHKIKLVKMDCEGSEFVIFPSTDQWDRVERLVGEVHGYRREFSVPDFYAQVKTFFPVLEVKSYCPEFGLDNFFASR